MSVRDYGIAAPHGPNVDNQHHATQGQFDHLDMSQNESQIFQSILKPDDMYTPEGVYWADLPFGQKVKFVQGKDAEEAKRELKVIGRMIKNDPLSPLGAYMRNMVIPGAGLLLEGYAAFLYSIVRVLIQPQLRAVLHWKHQAPPRCCIPTLLRNHKATDLRCYLG
jgi:hypothetical protein